MAKIHTRRMTSSKPLWQAYTLLCLWTYVSPAGTQTQPTLPHVSLQFADLRSAKAAQISTMLSGPFGGYGQLTTAVSGSSRIDIPASVDKIAADHLRAIVYQPGCEIKLIDLVLSGSNVQRRIECRWLPQTPLRGHLTLDDELKQKAGTLEIEIVYYAYLGHKFFNIADGFVTTFAIAIAPVDPDGRFSAFLPELNKDPAEMRVDAKYRGNFSSRLRRKKSGNPLGSLVPAEFSSYGGGLEPRSLYPQSLTFTLRRDEPPSSPIQTETNR